MRTLCSSTILIITRSVTAVLSHLAARQRLKGMQVIIRSQFNLNLSTRIWSPLHRNLAYVAAKGVGIENAAVVQTGIRKMSPPTATWGLQASQMAQFPPGNGSGSGTAVLRMYPAFLVDRCFF